MFEHKGYRGFVEVDGEAGVIFGKVVGIRDTITFQGDTVPEALRAFQDSVDDYLEFCAERGESPDKPYSGKFLVRIDPKLHRMVADAAEVMGTSLNGLVEKTLAERFISQVGNRAGVPTSVMPDPKAYAEVS